MYNGIGLHTPRGSGTNGYVQANKFLIRSRPRRVEAKEFEEGQGAGGITRKANKDILEHDRKRQIELKLAVLEEELEEQGYDDDEILEQVEKVRKQLESGDQQAGGIPETGVNRAMEMQTHQIAARKEQKLEKMRAALELSDVKEGEAFDRELQAQRKEERIAAREEAEKERRKKELEAEKEAKRREKEREKEREREREKEREREAELRKRGREKEKDREREEESRRRKRGDDDERRRKGDEDDERRVEKKRRSEDGKKPREEDNDGRTSKSRKSDGRSSRDYERWETEDGEVSEDEEDQRRVRRDESERRYKRSSRTHVDGDSP